MLQQLLLFFSILFFVCLSPCLHADESRKVIFAADLDLTIIGTIISKDNNNVVLLKFKSSGAVKALRVGFPLLEKYTIRDIQSNYLVVSPSSGEDIKIYKDGFVSASPQPSTQASTSMSLSSVSNIPENYREEGFERSKEKIEMTEAYRDHMIQQDLPKILMQASAEPILENGQIVGFMLDQIEDNSIYAKAGLTNGDIVTMINDISLHDVTATIKLLHSLKNAKDISVEIKRGGQTMPIQIKVK